MDPSISIYTSPYFIVAPCSTSVPPALENERSIFSLEGEGEKLKSTRDRIQLERNRSEQILHIHPLPFLSEDKGNSEEKTVSFNRLKRFPF